MSRKKINQTAANKPPVKKTSNKKAPKRQESVALAVEKEHEETVVAVNHEEPIATVHEEVVIDSTEKNEALMASALHEHVDTPHHHEDASESKNGLMASIIAFKESNETQFYGIVALAVFVLIIIL